MKKTVILICVLTCLVVYSISVSQQPTRYGVRNNNSYYVDGYFADSLYVGGTPVSATTSSVDTDTLTIDSTNRDIQMSRESAGKAYMPFDLGVDGYMDMNGDGADQTYIKMTSANSDTTFAPFEIIKSGSRIAHVDSNGTATYAGGLIMTGYSHVGASRNTTTSDFYIGVSSDDGAITITLDTDTVTAGRTVYIKDEDGNASVNNITIATEAAETIDGSATLTIENDYNAVGLYSDGTNWFIF